LKFVWVPSLNRYRRTEGEVKKEKLAYEVLEIDTDKDALIERFNGYEERIERLTAMIPAGGEAIPSREQQLDEGYNLAGEQEAAPPPPPAAKPLDEAEAKRKMVAMLQGMRTEEIENKILESRGNAFARYLLAGISRLGELGAAGWRDVQGFRNQFGDAEAETGTKKGVTTRIPGSEERGLRYLALAQIEALNPPEPTEQAEAA
jgi:hypothetical protein